MFTIKKHKHNNYADEHICTIKTSVPTHPHSIGIRWNLLLYIHIFTPCVLPFKQWRRKRGSVPSGTYRRQRQLFWCRYYLLIILHCAIATNN